MWRIALPMILSNISVPLLGMVETLPFFGNRLDIASGNDGRCFNHEDDRALRCTRTMDNTFGHDKSFLRLKVN